MGYLLVLGAGSEVAKAAAIRYATSGYDIYLADKNPEQLEEIKTRINEEFGVNAQAIKFDVTEFYNHRNFYHSLPQKPVGVICAVDYQGDGLRAQKDFLEAKRIIDINYTGLVAMLNIIANDFEASGSGFITVIGQADDNNHYIYKSSKEALYTYVSGLKSRLAGSNINVMIEDTFTSPQKEKDSWKWMKKILWK